MKEKENSITMVHFFRARVIFPPHTAHADSTVWMMWIVCVCANTVHNKLNHKHWRRVDQTANRFQRNFLVEIWFQWILFFFSILVIRAMSEHKFRYSLTRAHTHTHAAIVIVRHIAQEKSSQHFKWGYCCSPPKRSKIISFWMPHFYRWHNIFERCIIQWKALSNISFNLQFDTK